MKIKLVFDDWRGRDGKSIYQTETGLDLSSGDFHSGTIFPGEIFFSCGTEEEWLQKKLKLGFTPVFYVVEDK